MSITYRVTELMAPGLWPEQRLGGKIPTREDALAAATQAAERYALAGQLADIKYQRADGTWTTERSNGGDRPEADVVDHAKE